MRVQIGKHTPKRIDTSTKFSGQQNLKELEDQIGQDLVDSITVETQEVSESWLRQLGEVVKEAAIVEAARMFDVMADLMDQPNRMGIRGSDFPFVRGLKDRTLSPVVRTGSVSWQDLSLSHIYRKAKRHPQNKYNMFKYTGYLQAYFRSFGREIVTSKLGGVEVQVDPTSLYERQRANLDIDDNPRNVRGELFQNKRLRDNKRWRSLESLLLGSVTLHIFPKLSPMLLPMLSSNRWTDAGRGALEDKLFRGTKVGYKLLNKNNPYRPLVTPTAQYWLALQIPDAVFRRVNERFSRSDTQVSRFLNGA